MQSKLQIPPKTLNALKKHDFLAKTYQQLNKDLNGLLETKLMVNASPSHEPLTELIHQLAPIVIELTEKNKLAQFIYSIDLKESTFKSYLNATLSQNDFLAHIVIRAAQKVYLRTYFKSF
ncbi:hypothetical protein DNU06_11560 [Putridiphycobacter roseus]|uniref:Uncharacterized protein n=1 Tax=Putridiphycobacter roseus TaxID=2219161 RepID=A0A2W1NFS2_9FLAO|nr:hypothetical protein [Putridiphycobacter roseus]PZE16886.1 hypothetical protein DNU06_11560 [Putridiphycobacter roseus]